MLTSRHLKFLSFSVLILLFSFTLSRAQKSMGEPVPGAEVYIEQETGHVPIIASETDRKGRFEIRFPKGYKFSKSGTLKLIIKPPKKTRSIKKKFPGIVQQTITIAYTTKNGMIDASFKAPGIFYSHAWGHFKNTRKKGSKRITTLKFILFWNPAMVTANGNRGGFAIGGFNPV